MPVGIIGAGLIGRMHIDRALAHAEIELVGIADPTPEAEALARTAGVPWFADYGRMIDTARPRGVVVATPNATHARIAIDCIERGVAAIVEKPIAHDLSDAQRICDASARSGVPVLVGHHRRYNPISRRAKEIVASGTLGTPVCATVLSTWLKPNDYFVPWRREPGGGPVLINLIHDIDLLRFLLGEIESVQAIVSNRVRGFAVEDTSAVIAKFRNGALATITVSDTAAAPWNWDLAAGEAERFPRQDVDAYFLSGTEASLTLPRLEIWNYRNGRGWHDPLTVERTALHRGCPYTEQWRHFRALIDGSEQPVCSAIDGLRTLEATIAVQAAAESCTPVRMRH
ncbi:MAG: oxidoreductase [Alphaproteobacteria bacterium]|nr:MAG: oxidoreductase [Alphaproteobacteria bacterium]